MIELDLSYSRAQSKIFFECEKRRRIITKGRRLGFTQGGSQAMIEYMLSNPIGCLWGDTVNGNIDRYIERYWNPVLKKLPRSLWDYKKVEKKMFIGESFCDFRSADNPENWEGFGYHVILLNEAGIILKNPYLYENAVRPMLLDFPDSILIAGGTPKGKTPPIFYDLWQRGQRGAEDFASFQFSTYDNPWIDPREVDKLIAEMSDPVVDQEIYGKFSDTTEWQFIEGGIVEDALKRDYHDSNYTDQAKVMGIDLAGSGADFNAMTKRQGLKLVELQRRQTLKADVLIAWIAKEIRDWRPDAVFIDGGFNPAVIDILQNSLHFNEVMKVDFGGDSSDPYYYNKRAQMWGGMRDWLALGGAIPEDRKLRKQLLQQTYEFRLRNKKTVVILTSKEKMRSEGLDSPDDADSLALTFAYPVRKMSPAERLAASRNRNQGGYETDYDMLDL